MYMGPNAIMTGHLEHLDFNNWRFTGYYIQLNAAPSAF